MVDSKIQTIKFLISYIMNRTINKKIRIIIIAAKTKPKTDADEYSTNPDVKHDTCFRDGYEQKIKWLGKIENIDAKRLIIRAGIEHAD